MKCAIMQPTYLPWAGYFNLMNAVDLFIIYDDVQFARRSWQQRNRIVLHGKETFLSVPVITKGRRSQFISEVETDEAQSWRYDHIEKLRHAYKKHKYGKEMLQVLEASLNNNSINNLIDINMSVILSIKNTLGISTPIMRSSNIPVQGKKSEYLYNLCEYVKASEYISPIGSKDYIEEEGIFLNSNIEVKYQNFVPNMYPQKGIESFIPFMSIVDVIANIGFDDAYSYVSGGYTM